MQPGTRIETRLSKYSQPIEVTITRVLKDGVYMVKTDEGREFAIQDRGDVKVVNK